MQPLPLSDPLDPRRFLLAIEQMRRTGGLRRVLLAAEAGVPSQPRVHSSRTAVPFLMLCLHGRFEAQVMQGGSMRAVAIGEREAIWYPAGRWVDVFHFGCRCYARITFDHDHSLFGLKDQLADTPKPERSELMTLPLGRQRPALLEAQVEAMGELPADDSTRARSLLDSLLHEACAFLRRGGDGDPSESRWLSLREQAERHWREGLDRQGLAAAAGLSPTHVSRLFRKHAGCGFATWLQRRRVAYAQDLLRSSELDLAAIAALCGFTDASHCCRVFRQHCRLTPMAWRLQRVAAAP